MEYYFLYVGWGFFALFNLLISFIAQRNGCTLCKGCSLCYESVVGLFFFCLPVKSCLMYLSEKARKEI